MMHLSLEFRRLVLKNIPQLTKSDLDKYDSLLALHQHNQLSKGMITIRQQSKQKIQKDSEEAILEKAQSILVPVKNQYNMVRRQWYARREYALAQGHFQQIPLTIEGLVRFIRLCCKYHWINAYSTIYLFAHKLLYYIRLIKNKPLYKITALFLIALSIGILVYALYFHGSVELEELQKDMAMAETEAKKQKILEKLDEYYLTRPVPAAINQTVQSNLDSLIHKQEKDKVLALLNIPINPNIYRAEIDLTELVREALIAQLRNDDETFQKIMSRADSMANRIDQIKDSTYWESWITKVSHFNKMDGAIWIKAHLAAKFCRRDYITNYKRGEKYGIYALQLSHRVGDQRLRLDIVHCLLTMLCESYGYYNLFYPFAEREIQRADELKYHLRSTGFTYNYANTLYKAGQYELAMNHFLIVLQKVQKYQNVPYINWYKKSTQLNMAKIQWEYGNYEKSISICNQINKNSLDARGQINYHNIKGIAYRCLGHYDKAHEEYEKAFHLAVKIGDVNNQIIELRNLSTLYFRLTEYDKATVYLNKAIGLLLKEVPQNIDMRCKLFNHLAEIQLAQNNTQAFGQTLQEVSNLAQQVELVSLKAHILRTLGDLYMKAQNHAEARDHYKQAIMLYEKGDFLRAGLETRMNLIESLVHLSEYQRAKDMLASMEHSDTKLQDEFEQIKAMGMTAYIAYKEKNINRAIQESNQFIRKIENLNIQFMNADHLTFFQQKVNTYLKHAVLYELERQQPDSALIKLDYLKARALKHQPERMNNAKSPQYIDIKHIQTQLSKNTLVIHYMILFDHIYVFALTQEGLEVYRKPVTYQKLKKLIQDSVNMIHRTVDLFQNNQTGAYVSHYHSLIALNDTLCQILIGWPELRDKIQKTSVTYMIPDDILYQIPFSSLVWSNGEEPQFLIHQTAVTMLPSLDCIPSIYYEKEPSLQEKKILYSVDREYPGADRLIELIQKQFPFAKELYIDHTPISKLDILSTLTEAWNIYFFIGHGVSNTKIPDSSYFEITAINKMNKTAVKVKVTMAELKGINWSHANLVFLIGCETGLGKLYAGTGLFSFQHCFLAGGAKAVLANMWKIDANQTISQITMFINAMMDGTKPTLALQEMETATIQNLYNDQYYKYPHPYIWGSYTLSQASMN